MTELSATRWKIVAFCDIPRTMAEIMGKLELSHRHYFRRIHLKPLLRGGVLRMTHPDRPNHPDQAYVLTDAMIDRSREVQADPDHGLPPS